MPVPCIIFEDGVLVKNTITDCLWNGMFSKAVPTGAIVKYVQSCLQINTILVIPKCDGNINRHSPNWDTDIQPYIDHAKQTNKTFILGVLSQIDEELDVNYLYLPLDDDFFMNGVCSSFAALPKWDDRSSRLCWRGGCSGGGRDSIRVRFMEEIYKKTPDTDVRLSTWWSENKNIPDKYFADRVDHRTFFNHKIFFVVDGNVIASNHMYAFASGSVPFLVSNGICWFSKLIVPFVHYIPVKPDMSDLWKQIEWVNANDKQAEQIAINALKFANTYFSAEYQKQYIRDTIRQFCSSERMIVDCFMFYNEMDILNYRLNLLNSIVDYFVLVESNQTHAGNPKELLYKNNKHMFEKFNHKIIHVVVDLPFVFPNINYNKEEQWINERHQRSCVDIGLSQIMASDNDIIVISDVDEIPDPITLLDLKSGRIKLPSSGASLLQQMYYYNLNTLHSDIWCRSNVILYGDYVKTSANSLRDNSSLVKIPRGGWHLSYFGDKKFIRNKLMEFSHQEYNNDSYTAEDKIEQRIRDNSDLFGRGYVSMKYIDIMDNDYLPPLYDVYLSNYYGEKELDVPIYIYFHICCINNWKEVVANILFKLKNSGLYDKVSEIRCVVLGVCNDLSVLTVHEKIKIVFQSDDIGLFERKTMNIMREDCINSSIDFNTLYIHSKGVRHTTQSVIGKNVRDWVDFLSYFNIYKHELCLSCLDDACAVGVNLQSHETDYPLHFSGNCWWSKSSHVKRLHEIVDCHYNSPEFWVTSVSGIYRSLWNSGINHYDDCYPSVLYENKIVRVIEIKSYKSD